MRIQRRDGSLRRRQGFGNRIDICHGLLFHAHVDNFVELGFHREGLIADHEFAPAGFEHVFPRFVAVERFFVIALGQQFAVDVNRQIGLVEDDGNGAFTPGPEDQFDNPTHGDQTHHAQRPHAEPPAQIADGASLFLQLFVKLADAAVFRREFQKFRDGIVELVGAGLFAVQSAVDRFVELHHFLIRSLRISQKLFGGRSPAASLELLQQFHGRRVIPVVVKLLRQAVGILAFAAGLVQQTFDFGDLFPRLTRVLAGLGRTISRKALQHSQGIRIVAVLNQLLGILAFFIYSGRFHGFLPQDVENWLLGIPR